MHYEVCTSLIYTDILIVWKVVFLWKLKKFLSTKWYQIIK